MYLQVKRNRLSCAKKYLVARTKVIISHATVTHREGYHVSLDLSVYLFKLTLYMKKWVVINHGNTVFHAEKGIFPKWVVMSHALTLSSLNWVRRGEWGGRTISTEPVNLNPRRTPTIFGSSLDWHVLSFFIITRDWIAITFLLAKRFVSQRILIASPLRLSLCVVSNNEAMHHVNMQNMVFTLHMIRIGCTL